MNINEIEKIVKIFEASALSKMELEGEDITIKLEKGSDSTQAAPVMVQQTCEAAAVMPSVSMVEDGMSAVQAAAPAGHVMTSPLVGTFYRSNVKDGAPLVAVGDVVKKGDILCIIEAMKMMNEIRSDVDGVILSVEAENETMVEYDQPLICIGDAR
ncbi:MAG: acetyl-CoA carboxylase biotin carboxyl carrier protein [Oscillospiraceae bacterium]